jgi:hypothetical protein
VKGTFNKDLTYNDRMMVRSWLSQTSLNCGTGVGVSIYSADNSNIRVDSIRGFNKAVEIFCMYNSTLTISNVLCNYGFYVRFTPIIDQDTKVTNVEPLVTGNTINYNGITNINLDTYLFVPADPVYAYDAEDIDHLEPLDISTYKFKEDPTLFKVYKHYIYQNGVTPADDAKLMFTRNTVNINNLGGFWAKLIDGMYMVNNTFNIKANYFDAKIVRNDMGTIDNPDPDLEPTYTVTNQTTGFNVINSSYCAICNVDEFVTFEKSYYNIINSTNLFPYDLASANNGQFIINNCAPAESITTFFT